MLRIALICGGPSLERGISLNSARSLLDHLHGIEIEVHPVFVSQDLHFYSISPAQLYSNTPLDFDFKLGEMGKLLDFHKFLENIDLVFPAVHGEFGEDGELQKLLEEQNIPFVGSGSLACSQMFNKDQAADILRKCGFPTFTTCIFSQNSPDISKQVELFFKQHKLKRAIIKPSSGGSSLGVYSVGSPEEAFEKCCFLFSQKMAKKVLLEPFSQGKEFTVVVFESILGEPAALIPTEIETSYDNHQIFDFRKKYLPTDHTQYHTPPRFDSAVIQQIRSEAEDIFKRFHMRDFARLDGWVMPDNTIYFTDLNPISGMEQNSFLFRQAAVCGMTHRKTLHYLLQHACKRYNIPYPEPVKGDLAQEKKPIFVLFGGSNAERQVSLMSGSNVWLKLLQSDQYAPTSFLYDHQKEIWELPYSFALNHTVEEVYANCVSSEKLPASLILEVQKKLGVEIAPQSIPSKMSIDGFVSKAIESNAFIFIAMHGGEGENGTLQKIFEQHQIAYNGSDSAASSICMNKLLTGQMISKGNDPAILTLPKKAVSLAAIHQWDSKKMKDFWEQTCQELSAERLIIKPMQDGCSAGIALLQNSVDLEIYCNFCANFPFIPPNTFLNQINLIEMPVNPMGEYLFEPYIETDLIQIKKNTLNHIVKEGWIELTVGLIEQNGVYYSLNPSITIAEGAVLSLEEKFQGGTGVNITPPPENVISSKQTKQIKKMIEKSAQFLGIKNYARIDIFFNITTEKMIVIEANTLPALTPSTVLYQQGLAEIPSLPPKQLLETIIANRIECKAGPLKSCR